jgi:hypothetical protein
MVGLVSREDELVSRLAPMTVFFWGIGFAYNDVRTEIQPAKTVLGSSAEFLRLQLPKLGKKCRSELAKLAFGGSQAATGTHQSEDLVSQLNSMTIDQLSTYLESEASGLGASRSDFEERRHTATSKFTGALQRSIVSFQEFLQTFSGIVTIVSAADAQFGGVACAALSLLFVVSISIMSCRLLLMSNN